jgi:succinate dehydrogenase / fumarate reductase membrane anchor subunit
MILWVISFFGDISKSNITTAISHLRKPFNIIMLLILFFTLMYHDVLGMQVVIGNYISCRAYRFVLVVGIQIFTIITSISFAFAAFYIIIL